MIFQILKFNLNENAKVIRIFIHLNDLTNNKKTLLYFHNHFETNKFKFIFKTSPSKAYT